jgi:hypothetical protein
MRLLIIHEKINETLGCGKSKIKRIYGRFCERYFGGLGVIPSVKWLTFNRDASVRIVLCR